MLVFPAEIKQGEGQDDSSKKSHGIFYGKSASRLMYELSTQVGHDSMEILW